MDGGPKRFLDGTFKPFSLCGNTEGQSAMDSGGLQNFMNDILHDNVFKDGSASQTNEPVEEEDDVSVHREIADDDASSKDSSLQSLFLSEGDGRDQSDDLGDNACRPSLDLQERLSSIRTPHFAQSQHFRECNDTIAGETFREQIPHSPRSWDQIYFARRISDITGPISCLHIPE